MAKSSKSGSRKSAAIRKLIAAGKPYRFKKGDGSARLAAKKCIGVKLRNKLRSQGKSVSLKKVRSRCHKKSKSRKHSKKSRSRSRSGSKKHKKCKK
jgi:hypothetical protein